MKRPARIRRRLAHQRGFTLIELMVAASVGMVIVGVAFGLLDSVVRTFGSTGDRVDVSQRGRLAMDELTQRLRSQVCGGNPTAGYTPAIVAATNNKIVFWADRGGALAPALRGLEYVNGRINEYTYPGSDPNAAPATTRLLVSSVAPNNGGGLFQYSAYNPAAANQTANPAPPLWIDLPAPLGAADYQRVVRITVGFTAYPANGSPADKTAADFTGDFVSRTATSPYEFDVPPTETTQVEPRCK
jgi:prepilin-type N-terminal cleavage/methylation domain-containing protein